MFSFAYIKQVKVSISMAYINTDKNHARNYGYYCKNNANSTVSDRNAFNTKFLIHVYVCREKLEDKI